MTGQVQARGGPARQTTADGAWEAKPGWPLGSSQLQALRPPDLSAQPLQHPPSVKRAQQRCKEMPFLLTL